MLVSVYPRSLSAEATRRATAELRREPGKDFLMPASKAEAEAALAVDGMAERPASGAAMEASAIERGVVMRASRVATSTTSSLEEDMSCTTFTCLPEMDGAKAADWATKLAPRRKVKALLRPNMVDLQRY